MYFAAVGSSFTASDLIPDQSTRTTGKHIGGIHVKETIVSEDARPDAGMPSPSTRPRDTPVIHIFRNLKERVGIHWGGPVMYQKTKTP